MKYSLLIASTGLIVLSLTSLASESQPWTYQGKTGAQHWGSLEEDYAMCKTGHHQSPIDIETRKVKRANAGPIKLSYVRTDAEVENNGHTIEVSPENAGSITIDGVDYKLVQFHFHTPSEEKINGRHYEMVAHLVHKNADGKLAVIAVLFKLGKENQTLKPVFADLPGRAGEKHPLAGKINVIELLPPNHANFRFVGSLTTPPCSEDVRWFVMKTPMTISSRQLQAFKKLYPMNARPTQPLNGREVQEGQ